MKIQKKNWGGGVGGGGGVGRGFFFWGGQSGCEQIEVFWIIFTKKKKTIRGGGLGRGESGGGGVGLVGGVRVDVNAMLGVGSGVGYWGCKPRIEGIVQCTKRYCTILRKLKKCGGGGAIFEPKTLAMYLKKKKKKKGKKKIDRAGIRTHDLRVRNPLG